jgi:predicted acetyltransferase
MHFRKATNADIALLARQNQQLIQDEGHRNRMSLPELENRMRSWLHGEYEAIIFEHDGRPIAYALCRTDGDGIYLRQFFVDRQYRRKGFGRQAIKMLLSNILPREKRVTVDILINNQSGQAFWKALGFIDYAITLEMLPEAKDGSMSCPQPP